jgi:MFS family permease
VIQRGTVLCLGLSQLVCWGISYYLIGAFGGLIAADLGWSQPLVHGGFSLALLVMGLASPLAGRLIDRHGGRPVMAVGSGHIFLGCVGLSLAHHVLAYYAAWFCLGVAMRLTLYDAAFATLARIGGQHARRPMAQITLLGGLASTTFWPIGHALAASLGWRGGLLAYAGLALLTVPLHLAIPRGRHGEPDHGTAAEPGPAPDPGGWSLAGGLYALIATAASFLNAGMSAHMIGILAGLGVALSAAVWISALRGIGQSLARLGEVLFGARVPPLDLNLAAAAVLPFCFAVGLFSGQLAVAAVAFAFLYGGGNGLLTITRGTLPLVLFDHRVYGTLVGRLLVPSFLLSAAAPLSYALLIERFGTRAALHLSIGVSAMMLGASIVLRARFGPSRGTREASGEKDG